MKFKSLGLISAFAALAMSVSAQDYSSPQFAKYGDSVEERKANVLKYNQLRDAYNMKQYGEASKYFNELLKDCPGIGQNLYIMGSTVYKNKIATSKTIEERKHYVDSLMIIHDVRSENFGDNPTRGTSYIKTEKVKDAIAYVPMDIDRIVEYAHHAFEASNEENLNLDVVKAYFFLLSEGYSNDNVETEVLLNEYDYLSSVVAKSNDEKKDEVRTTLDQIFVQSGAATCENLELIYKPQFEADNTNIDLIKKVAGYLARQECDGEFPAAIAEAYYRSDPSAGAAISIATAAKQAKDYEKAFKFYDEAIELESDTHTKSQYALSAAGAALLSENPRLAAEYSRKSIAIEENGLSYFFLAQAQAQGLTACSGFDKQAAFWIVVDNLLRARNLIESSSDEAAKAQLDNVNKSIATYSAGFPTAEEVFFRTLTPGSSYSVSCGWVSGSTTIRERK